MKLKRTISILAVAGAFAAPFAAWAAGTDQDAAAGGSPYLVHPGAQEGQDRPAGRIWQSPAEARASMELSDRVDRLDADRDGKLASSERRGPGLLGN